MTRGSEFKRIIVGLPQAAGDYSRIGVTAKLAELLRLDLVAMFADDRSLLHAAGLPCVRELRALGGGWQEINALQLGAELEANAATARRLFAEVENKCSVETSFRVEQGSPAEVISLLATGNDIVAIIEPRNPAEWMTRQLVGLVESAFRAAASVMIVPKRVARDSGLVVAVATTPTDPSIATAMSIAMAAREKLLVLGPEHLASSYSAVTVGPVGSRIEFAVTALGSGDGTQIAENLGRRSERLIVISRGTLQNSAVQALASLRSVPIIVIEPDGPLPEKS